MPRTIIEKLWDSHVVDEQPSAPALLYIDLHLVHEVTSPQAFQGLRERGLKVRRPDLTIATADHSIPTTDRALAFGIGTSEVEHVLATECLLQRESKTFQVRVDGRLKPGVSAKDIILALIAKIGAGGGTGSVLEYTGSAIRALDMEERMTVCNMSIEGGARAGLMAPDDTTFQYLRGRPH